MRIILTMTRTDLEKLLENKPIETSVRVPREEIPLTIQLAEGLRIDNFTVDTETYSEGEE